MEDKILSKGNKFLFICLMISLCIHLSMSVFIYPVIGKHSFPMIFGYPDILSISDLRFSEKSEFTAFSKDILLMSSGKLYFSNFFPSRVKFLLPLKSEEKIVYSEEGLAIGKRKTFTLNLLAPTLLFARGSQKIIPKYTLARRRGKIIFINPRIICEDYLASTVGKYLIHNFMFLEGDKIFWTEIRVMIK